MGLQIASEDLAGPRSRFRCVLAHRFAPWLITISLPLTSWDNLETMETASIVGRIYESLLTDQGDIDRLLCSIADQCGAMTASMAINHPLVELNRAVTPRVDQSALKTYLDHWVHADPIFARAALMPVGQIGLLDEAEDEQFRKSDLYNEGWKSSGLGVNRRFVNITRQNNYLVNFAIFANPKNERLSQDVDQKLRLYLPHFTNAMELSIRTRQLETERYATTTLLGERAGTALFVLNNRGEIAFADEYALRLLDRSSEVRVVGGKLSLRSSEGNHRLQHQFWCHAHGNFIPGYQRPVRWRCERDGGLFELEIIPCAYDLARSLLEPANAERSCLLVLVTDHAQKARHILEFLRHEFGLTYAESLLAAEIMKGDGRVNAAKRCGISLNTARAHLRSIFGKMSIERQSQLIAEVHKRVHLRRLHKST